MNHVEGGWPKEVDYTEAEHVIRYRKKVQQVAAMQIMETGIEFAGYRLPLLVPHFLLHACTCSCTIAAKARAVAMAAAADLSASYTEHPAVWLFAGLLQQ